jgi:hypothetical protein
MIEGRRFLVVAEALATYEGEEFVRTRIGRLYYATWLEARSYCEAHLGYRREKMAREHQAIASLMGTIDASLAYELRLLRDARNQADYDDHLPGDYMETLLRTVETSSSRILTRLDALREGTTGE